MFEFKVEDGSAYPDSNSYASVEYADDYISAFGLSENWSELSTEDKQKSLMRATRFLDSMVVWNSGILKTTQALAWPRFDFNDANGRPVSSKTIPQKIINSTVELAASSLEYPLTTESVSLAEEQFGSSRDRYASPLKVNNNPVVGNMINHLSLLGYGRNRTTIAIIYRA